MLTNALMTNCTRMHLPNMPLPHPKGNRPTQQDALLCMPVLQGSCGEEGVFVVADGHGVAGEMSQLAVNVVGNVLGRRYDCSQSSMYEDHFSDVSSYKRYFVSTAGLRVITPAASRMSFPAAAHCVEEVLHHAANIRMVHATTIASMRIPRLVSPNLRRMKR